MADKPTITQLALDLHTDLVNIKVYATKSPDVVRALIIAAEEKIDAITTFLDSAREAAPFAFEPVLAPCVEPAPQPELAD